MLSKGCSYVAQRVQTVHYVDTATEKTDENRVVVGHTATEHVLQQNGVETVSRQRECSKRVPRQDTRQQNTGDREAVSRNYRCREKLQSRSIAWKLGEAEVWCIFFLTWVRQKALFTSPFFSTLFLFLISKNSQGRWAEPGAGDQTVSALEQTLEPRHARRWHSRPDRLCGRAMPASGHALAQSSSLAWGQTISTPGRARRLPFLYQSDLSDLVFLVKNKCAQFSA
jgi:hypothetical protein